VRALRISGCYIETLNAIPQGSRVRLRLTHHDEALEVLGKVAYYSYGLGTPEKQAKLDHWLNNPDEEF
jgi:hypothetical protein